MKYSNTKSQSSSSSKCSTTVSKKLGYSDSTLDKRAKHNEVEKRSRAIRNQLIDNLSSKFSNVSGDQTVEDTLTFSKSAVENFFVCINVTAIKNDIKSINEGHFLSACKIEQQHHHGNDFYAEENEPGNTKDCDYENEPIDIDDNNYADYESMESIANILKTLSNFKQ